MQKELTCEQVCALLTFYVENRLNDPLKKYVEHHLNSCPNCRDKFQKLKKIVNNFNEITKKIHEENSNDNEQYLTKQYENFKFNLSAYIDNELTDEENLRIKKIAISNPIARKDLEDIYTFKKLLHSSFDKTRNEIKEDYSKNILNKITIKNTQEEKDLFGIIITIFFLITTISILGMVKLFML